MAKSVLYIIPNNGIGGVERLFDHLKNSEELANVKFLALSRSKQGPFSYLLSLFKMYGVLRTVRPSAVIGSLWRVHLIMIILKHFIRLKYIPFYHSARSRSLIDHIASFLVYKKSEVILYDSVATSRRYNNIGKDIRVLSLFTCEPKFKDILAKPKMLSFVYVGRIAKVKNIEESLLFLQCYQDIVGFDIKYDIYGPLEYDLDISKFPFARLCGTIEQQSVLDVILNYDVFLQTSKVEGFAMTAKECLRAGQFCVLTAVGDLENFKHDELFLTFDSFRETAFRLNELSSHEIVRYQKNAIDKFSGANNIVTDFLNISNEFSLPNL